MNEPHPLRIGSGSVQFHACLEGKFGFWLRMADRAFNDLLTRDFYSVSATPLEYYILIIIDEYPQCRQVFIAQALGIKGPNLTMAIDHLVRRGYISKLSDSSDRRAFRLHLTKCGADFVQVLNQRHSDVIQIFFCGEEYLQYGQSMIERLKDVAVRPGIMAARRFLEEGGHRRDEITGFGDRS